MPIHAEKVDKQFIKDCFIKDLERVTSFSICKNSSWFHVNLKNKHGEGVGLGMGTIEKLSEKYKVCSFNAMRSNDGEMMMSLTLQRKRWNVCDECRRILWRDNADDVISWERELKFFKRRTVCLRCFNRLNRRKNELKK